MKYDFEYLKDIGATAETVELKRELDTTISEINAVDQKMKEVINMTLNGTFKSTCINSLEEQKVKLIGKQVRAKILLCDAIRQESERRRAAELIVDEEVAPILNAICLQMQELIDMIAEHWSEYDKLCALIPTLEDCMHLMQDEYPENLCKNCM